MFTNVMNIYFFVFTVKPPTGYIWIVFYFDAHTQSGHG